MVSRITSGIAELDQAIQGGYPRGSIISIYGKTSNLRNVVSFSFLQEDAVKNSRQLYITTKFPVERIQEEINLNNFMLDNLLFLDAVNWRNKRVNPKQESIAEYSVNNLTDLNALLAKIMEACKKHNIDRILFDSPTSLLLYSTPGKEQVFKFFELLSAFIRSNEMNLCYNLEKDLHDDDIVATMHYLSDGVIDVGDMASNFHHIKVIQMAVTKFSTEPIRLQDIDIDNNTDYDKLVQN